MGRPVEKSKQTYSRHPFLTPPDELFQQLKTHPESGLNAAQVNEASLKYGANKLDGEGGVQWYTLLIKQASNAMILVSFT